MHRDDALGLPGDVTGVEVVGYDEHLFGEAAALRALEWGGSPEANRAYLRWKYLQNPYLPDPLLSFATRGGEVIGMRGAMGTCWECDGRRHVLPHGSDLVVDSRFRRHGLARTLIRATDAEMESRGLAWTMSLSANLLGAKSSRSSGSYEVGGLPIVECGGTRGAARRRRLAERALGHLEQRRVGLAFARATRRRAARTGVDPFAELDEGREEGVLVSEHGAPEQLAAIAARSAADARLRHVRDAEYFAWRLSNPLSEYRVLTAQDAYVVLQRRGAGTSVGIVDWRFADPRVFAGLVGVVVRRVGTVRLWTASLDEVTTRIFRSVGHLEPVLDQVAAFVIRPLGSGPVEPDIGGLPIHDLSSWRLHMLDSDIT